MISRSAIRSWVAAQIFLTIGLATNAIAQTNYDAPIGPRDAYNGIITTAGSYDAKSGNQMRTVDDLVVPGAVGAYPLKWTRYYNTNSQDGQWTFSYKDYRILGDGKSSLPDGRQIPAAGMPDYPKFETRMCSNGYYCSVGIFHLADGGTVEFDSEFVATTVGGYYVYWPVKLIDPYGQVTTFSYTTRGYYQTRAGAAPAPIYVLDKVTEPGGRYLQVTWDNRPACSGCTACNNGDLFANVISKVEGFDGQGNSLGVVNYHWIGMQALNDNCVPLLDQVTYSDGTTAHYTYMKGTVHLGGGTHVNEPVLVTADDVRYDGPVRGIAYGVFDSSGNFTFAPATESNLNTHELLSSANYGWSDAQQLPDGTWAVTYLRKGEIRGDGATRTFTYKHVCTWTHHPDETLECDDNNDGKIISYTDFLGNSTQISYYDETNLPYWSGAGFIQSVTDPNGHTTTYVRDDAQHHTWNITQIQYPDGSTLEQTYTDYQAPYYLASRTLQHGPNDPVRTITYTRDGNHRITRKDYPDGGWEEFDYNSFGEVTAHRRCKDGNTVETESFQYDGRGLKQHYTDANGGTTDYTYYASGPWADRLQTVTYPANASNQRASETYEYDRAYDANGENSGAPSGAQVAGRGLVTKITLADGSYKLFGYNKYGDKLWEEDELRHRTNYANDEYGRVLTVKTPLNHTTTNSYVPTSCATKSASDILCASPASPTITTSKLPFTTTLPSGKQTTFEYDTNWRKRFVHVAPGTGDAATTEWRYDEGQGNIGHLTTMVDPRGNSTTYGYDLRDRQTSVTDALGHTSRVVFDTRGVKITETHANNELIEYDGYDAMNRLTHKKVHRQTTPPIIDEVTLSYDCAGNQIANIDENHNTYAYSFDNMNRPAVMTYPNGKTEIHEYDLAGNVKKYTNRSAAVQTFSYDNRNRQINFTWSDGTSSQSTGYDAASRKTEIDNADATITLGYDDENHLTTQTEKEITTGVGDNVARTVAYTYDADGNRQNIQYPSGAAFNYTYTQRNQVATINPGLSGGNPIVTYTFDLSGNITNRALDNGTSTAYSVDQVNRDSAVAHSLNGTNRRFDYVHNAVNDITAVQRDGNVNDSDGFEYDLTQQILNFHQQGHYDPNSGMVVTPLHDNSMEFDGCGNRTKLNGQSQTFNTMNQPSGIPHDDDGDVQMYNGFTYTYDAQNRLRRAASAGITEDFYYDGLNRQVARVTTGAPPPPTPSPTASALPTATPTIPPLPTPTPTATIPPLPTITPTIPPIGTPTIPPLGTPTPTPTPTPAGQCSPVTFNESNHVLSMSTATSGATIFYTSDGSTPTHSGGTATGSTQIYNGSFTTPACVDTQYYALAYKSGYSDSNVTGYLSKHSSDFGCTGAMMMSASSTQTIVFSVWDGDWALLEEYDGAGNRIEGYVQGYHGLVKTLVANVYYYQDELGSTSHVANASGAMLEYYRYNLYGAPQFFDASGNPLLGGSAHNVVDLGNGGSRWMPELGLYDDRNRFMSPDLGRFLQPDPIGFKGDASNLYRYVGNDWANRTDPMGLDTYTEDREFAEKKFLGVQIWRGEALSSGFRYTATHTFAFTTDKNGRVEHTYSWGNTTNTRGWNLDQKEDLDAARAGLKNGFARKEGGASLDPYVEKAYKQLNKKENEHPNHWFWGNCKTEDGKLIKTAKELQKQDERKKTQLEKRTQNESKSAAPQPQSQQKAPQASNVDPGGDGDAWLIVGLALGGSRTGPTNSGPP